MKKQAVVNNDRVTVRLMALLLSYLQGEVRGRQGHLGAEKNVK